MPPGERAMFAHRPCTRRNFPGAQTLTQSPAPLTGARRPRRGDKLAIFSAGRRAVCVDSGHARGLDQRRPSIVMKSPRGQGASVCVA